METIELRVGNYYYDCSTDEIEIITGKTFLQIFTGKLSCMKPIPLTEEWLLNFGFEWKGLISKGRYLTIFTPCGKALVFKDNYFIFAGVTIETQIQYVHQLQSLYFALTGKELTFKSEI